MQIVIEIPDAFYEIYNSIDLNNKHWDEKYYVYGIAYSLLVGLQDGQPLPKGHGRLIDSDDMIEDLHRQCKEVFKLDAVKPEDYYIAKDAKFMQATWKEWCDSYCIWANKRKTIVEADGGDAE